MALPAGGVAREAEFLDSGARSLRRDFIVTCIHGIWHFWCPRRVPPFSCPGGPKLEFQSRRFPPHGFCRLGWPSAGTHRSHHGFSRVRAAAVFRLTVFADSDGPPRRGRTHKGYLPDASHTSSICACILSRCASLCLQPLLPQPLSLRLSLLAACTAVPLSSCFFCCRTWITRVLDLRYCRPIPGARQITS